MNWAGREFYLRIALRERRSKRELGWQLDGALFERVVLPPAKVSPPVRQLHPDAAALFKDTYLLDFLNLPDAHPEDDLQRALVTNLRQFLLELGRDFAFVGERYRLRVGGRIRFIAFPEAFLTRQAHFRIDGTELSCRGPEARQCRPSAARRVCAGRCRLAGM